MHSPRRHPATGRAPSRAFGLLVLLGVLSSCGPDEGAAGSPPLRLGEPLGTRLVVTGARIYPLEPMSPTSLRCAVRLDHPASGTWTEIFPTAGRGRPARFEYGDVHLPDGRVQREPPPAERADYEAAFGALRRRVARHSGDALLARCAALDAQSPPRARFWIPLGLGLLLLAVAVGLLRARPRLALVPALLGTGSLLAALVPILGGDSFGTQELQRLFAALKPLGVIASGEHGDVRQTAGLFLLYAPVAQAVGTVAALRLEGFVVLGAAMLVWVALRFRAAPGECLVGLTLLVHPVLAKGHLEVGPFAFVTAFALLVHLTVGTTEEVGRRRFGLGVLLQILLSAVSQGGALLGPGLVWLSVLRTRRSMSSREALARAAIVLVVALPFWIQAASGLGGEHLLRQAADRTPELAWGSRPLWELGRGVLLSALHGRLLAITAAVTLLVGALVWRSRWDGLVLVGIGLGILGALVGLGGTLRVQPYYGLYATVPLVLGLGRLVDGLRAPASRSLLGLFVLGLVSLDLAAAGPALARHAPSPRPAERVAEAARRAAADCPVLVAATNDLALPLLPHLADPRRLAAPAPLTDLESDDRRRPQDGTATGWRFPGAGLTVVTFFSRHGLPNRFSDGLLGRFSTLGRRGCVQVLYHRDFPLPRIHGILERRCTRAEDRGDLVLYRCRGELRGEETPEKPTGRLGAPPTKREE